jgi:hydroxyacylglutathione hydrolase
MNLSALPAFSDNYIWMLDDGRDALVVDPGEAGPVLQALRKRGLRLAAILVTHHHGDHTGGVDALRPVLEGTVWGPAAERTPEPRQAVRGGDEIRALGLRFEVIDVPGHTAGHVAYFAAGAPDAPLLFCGDTLFSAGCGRLFEGTAAQLHASLQRLAGLPADTRVCCTHEYTLSNLRFAQAVEPGNAALEAHRQWCEARRASDLPTLPSTLGLEARINPFLRCERPEVRASAHARGAAQDDPVTVFATLRTWKNEFR